jgi:hypothetical protein
VKQRLSGRILAGMGTHWGKHPDLDDQGNLHVDSLLTSATAAERDFDREYRSDYDQATAPIARSQRELPVEIQTYVGGRTHPGTPSEGLRSYQREVEWAKAEYARLRGYARFVTDEELARMSLAESEQVLDERGVPREGVLLWHTSRTQRLDDGMDGFSRTELQNIRPRR